MKKVLMLLAIVAIVAACQKDEIVNDDMTLKGAELVGTHYNLNIIGVKDKTADMTGSNGHVIFVPIEGATAIWLQEGEEYMVLDANGTDRDGAKLMLPDPGLDPYIIGELTNEDVISDYSVYVRPLGKPGGLSTITTCATVLETLGDFISKEDYRVLNRPGLFGGVASLEQVGAPITLREKGKSPWTNVTAQLLTIVLQIQYDDDGTGVIDDDDPIIYARIPIFDPLLENEYWEYVNDGLKLLQVRFYPWGTDVSESDLAEWK